MGHGFRLKPQSNTSNVLEEDEDGVIDPAISTTEFSNWGLMSSGSATGANLNFINPRQLNLLRLRVKSPGKN